MRVFTTIVSCLVLAGVGYLAAFYVTPPNIDAEAVRGPDGSWSLQVTPNFVVNDVRSIRVRQSGVELAGREGILKGRQVVDLPTNARPGVAVTVDCELQYDRVVPSITRVQRQVALK